MTENRAARDGKLKVFISYSRKDARFADELVAGLDVAGFAPYLDKHDIAPGEPWEERLGRLIGTADTVVFVISPDAVVSERCAWEVAETERLGKRLLPVVWRVVPEADVPERLKRLNYIFFSEGHSFARSLGDLSKALNTDLAWIREHTRLGELAVRWKALRGAEPLLRGREIDDAEAWLKRQQKGAPEPTPLHREFIAASRNAERVARSRARRTKALIGALALLLTTSGVGWWQQSWLREQYQWRVVMGPSVLSPETEKDKAAKPDSDFKECVHGCPTMIVVPAGKFTMGSHQEEYFYNERPQREVTIAKPFAVGRTEITFGEWDICAAAGACPKVPDYGWGRENRPVISVSWEEAKSYVAWLIRTTGKDYRLLSEAEWEYAARAGSQTLFSFGDHYDALGDHAWFGENSDRKTQPVARKKPNAFGLHDMHGNVWEWVEDQWHDDYTGAPTDGSAWIEGGNAPRVFRGGAYENHHPDYLRSSQRNRVIPLERMRDVGFRVGRTLRP